MSTIFQRTLKNTIRATGIGMFSGEKVIVTLRPAPADAGIVFRRVDLEPPVAIPALVTHVGDSTQATTLSVGTVLISGVEHLMAAFAGLGIDNVLVDVDGAELPIMDGSAAPFVFMLESAGIVDQAAPKKFIRILQETVYTDGEMEARLSPYDGFRVEYTLYDHPLFREHKKTAVIDFSSTTFLKEVSRARTFAFLADLKKLWPAAAGNANRDAVIVIDDFCILNEEGLRRSDEFVKHGILDAIGDLYLLGHSVLGAFSGHKSDHATTSALLKRVLANPRAWEIGTFESEREAYPISFARPAFG
ncbi:MAG TPA: UDP-3-O-acyl-N-acetylglucosamine deacetylase [Pseudomonadales bacterium]